MFSYLDIYDFAGPLLTFFGALFALFGEPYIKETKKLTTLGYLSIICIFLGLFVSLKSSNTSNHENEKQLVEQRNNFDSLKSQNQLLLKSNSEVERSNDTLNKTVQDLTFKLYQLKKEELERRIKEEKNKINLIKQNLRAEIILNLDMIKEFERYKIINFGDKDVFLTGKFEYDNLIISKGLKISFELKQTINYTIINLKNMNELINNIKSAMGGDIKKINISSLIRRYKKTKPDLLYILDHL